MLNVVIQTVIQPKVVGDAVGLSTTLTFVSLIFWTWVIGPLGALLAIPLTLLAKALLDRRRSEPPWVRPLISNKDEDHRGSSRTGVPPDPRRREARPAGIGRPVLVRGVLPRRADLRADFFAGLPGRDQQRPRRHGLQRAGRRRPVPRSLRVVRRTRSPAA